MTIWKCHHDLAITILQHFGQQILAISDKQDHQI